jgi:2-haloacid dehalogenase
VEVPRGILFDLLMGVMNSLEVWTTAAGDRQLGLAWRDAATRRMVAHSRYRAYADLVGEAASEVGLPDDAPSALLERWELMEPWPDAAALEELDLPYAFVTNCSTELALLAARRSGLAPTFTLSAQEAGWYKPDSRIYREACRRMGTSPQRVMFVAGSAYDAEGARALGMRTWFITRRPDLRPSVASIRAADSLGEVVAAIDAGDGVRS